MSWRFLQHFLPEIPGFTHAALPTYHDGNIYFSPRDSGNRSHIYAAYFDPVKLEMGKPAELLKPGRPGAFDDSGCSVCQVQDDEILYLGWNLGVTVPFRNALAIYKQSQSEIVKQRDEVLLSISYGWEHKGEVCYGGVMQFDPMVCLLMGSPSCRYDDVVCRPCVVGEEVFFCHRKHDGQYALASGRVERGNVKNIEAVVVERNGFDSTAQCYPCVFEASGYRYLLYNGDGYGKTGFGLAIWE